MSRSARFGVSVISLAWVAIIVILKFFPGPIHFLQAHMTRFSALFVVVIGGIGISVGEDVLSKQHPDRDKNNTLSQRFQCYVLLCLGILFVLAFATEVADFIQLHFDAIATPARRLHAIFGFAAGGSLFLIKAVSHWRAWRQVQPSRGSSALMK